MSDFSTRLRYLRNREKLTQLNLAEKLGLSKSSVNMYERGEREPGFETLEAIADLFNVDMNYLLGRSDVPRQTGYDGGPAIPPGFLPIPEMVELPLIGSIACGAPILAEQNVEGRVGIPSMWAADFILLCKGDSMAPVIQDGDLVAIRQQPEVENGQIAAVRIENEATLKRVFYQPTQLRLVPVNPVYDPIILVGEEMNSVHIEGRAVGICRGL